MPPLSQRREDVPLLFLQLVTEAAARYRRDHVEVPPETLAEIARRDWPGNVRELRNAADRFVLGLGIDAGTPPPEQKATGLSLAEHVSRFEKALIGDAIRASRGGLKPVYEALGISRKTLYEKMQKYGLDRRGDDA
jgi:two-component system C4-dicarboxylate transport response regulator DctD